MRRCANHKDLNDTKDVKDRERLTPRADGFHVRRFALPLSTGAPRQKAGGRTLESLSAEVRLTAALGTGAGSS